MCCGHMWCLHILHYSIVQKNKQKKLHPVHLFCLWVCVYLSIAVVFKLLPDEGVKSIPVRTTHVAA